LTSIVTEDARDLLSLKVIKIHGCGAWR